MNFGGILLLAFGVAMDAAAVSAARGFAVRRIEPRHVLLVALFFGGAQALMPLIGALLGSTIGSAVAAWDHWIAFVLLGAIGVKMLWEARETNPSDTPSAEAPSSLLAADPPLPLAGEGRGEGKSDHRDPFALNVMLLLAIATSIDALAVGITLPLLNAPLVLSVVTIGVTTGLLSAIALFAGRRFGAALGSRLDAVGGVVLIGIGSKILIDHLSAA